MNIDEVPPADYPGTSDAPGSERKVISAAFQPRRRLKYGGDLW
jgi:hypothetical protein